jgi:PAS domain S-box-containing protein
MMNKAKADKSGFALRLTLLHKVLLLISGLLIVELVIVGLLAGLFYESNQELNREENAHQVRDKTMIVLNDMAEAASAEAGYYFFKQPRLLERYNQAMSDIPEHIEEVKSLLGNNPDRMKAFVPAMESINRMIVVSNRIRQQVATGDKIIHLPDLIELKSCMERSDAAMSSFCVQERDAAQEKPLLKARLQSSLWAVLISGFVINVLIAIVMARYFHSKLAGRLETLMDNVVRFGNNQPLNPPVGGSDEIAKLDSVFNEMAGFVAQAAENERKINSRIQSIIEKMPVGLLITDPEGHVELANPAAQRTFQYTRDEITNQPVRILFAEDSDSGEDLLHVIKEKALGRIVHRTAVRKDGESFDAEISATPLQTLEGPRYLVIVLDVTERTQLEKMKQEFVAMVSHDLRQPLTSLKGAVALVAVTNQDKLDQSSLETLEMAETEIDRLTKLVQDLLDLARIEAGHMQLYLAQIKIKTVIKRAVASVRTFADRNKVAIEADPTNIELEADPDRLVQVLVNLLTNAVKFSPPNSAITISVTEDSDWVQVTITDRGRGIPESHRAAIFERFRQVEDADAQEKGGTGLGLSICKNIVEEHGGTIGVDSEEGKGSSFWFKLPKQHTAAVTAEATVQASSAAS